MESGPETAGPESSSADVSIATAIQKLKQQNEILKTELRQLKTSLEATLKTLKSGERDQLRPNFSQAQDSEMEALMSKIQNYKKEIASLRLQLAARDDHKIAELENNVLFLKSKITDLEAEHNSLKIVEKRQIGALESLQNDTELKRMTSSLKAEIESCREKEKATKQKFAKKQAEWKAVHQQMVGLEERYRELQRRKPDGAAPDEAQKKELEEWKHKVEVLERLASVDEKTSNNKLKEFEQKRKEAEDEKAHFTAEVARLDKEIPLKDLKLRELKTHYAQLQKRNAELLQLEAERRAKETQPSVKAEKAERLEQPADPQSTLFATQLEEST